MTLALIAVLSVPPARAALGSGDRQVFLKVNPLAGETKTSKSGSGGLGRITSFSNASSRSPSKTVTRTMKWNCEVRYRGKPLPQKVEVKAFYIGYEGSSMQPKILGKEAKTLKLDETGKASAELTSPEARQTKSRTSSGGSSYGRGHIATTHSTVKGERMAGAVVQLFEDGKLVKSWASQSGWEHAAKEESFSEEVLNRKEKNRLN